LVGFVIVQLTKEMGVVTAGITTQGANMILEERRNKIVESIFVPYEQPILPNPKTPTAKGKEGLRSKVVEATRCSSRQKPQAFSVLVS
jgi:hypothetical protein